MKGARSIQHGRRKSQVWCGRLLRKLKEKVGHNNWEPLFDESNLALNGVQKARFDFNLPQAWRYMKVEKDFKLTRQLTKGIEPFNLEKTCKYGEWIVLLEGANDDSKPTSESSFGIGDSLLHDQRHAS